MKIIFFPVMCVCEFGFSTILNLFAEYFLIVIIIGRGLT